MPGSLESIAGQFALPGVLVSCAPLGSGLINDTYEVTTSSGKFVLQKINTSIFTDPVAVMANMSAVLQHLPLQEAFPQNLTLIPTSDGGSFLKCSDGSCWRCFKKIEDAHTINSAQTADQAYQVSKGFAKFQKALNSLSPSHLTETIPDFHNTPARHARFEKFVRSIPPEKREPIVDVLNFIEERQHLIHLLWEDEQTPNRIVHNDTKINNVMLSDSDGTATCVIDLDTVMPGRSLYDFGDLVRTATASCSEEEQDLSKVHIIPDYYKAVQEAYLEQTSDQLTASEKLHLPEAGKVVTLELIIRFIEDHLQGDKYFKTAHPGQNAIRARNQMALIRSMETDLA